MNLNLFIAGRLFRRLDEGKRGARPAINIATAGVAVGLAVMIVAICTALGFRHEISEKVVGFGAHVQVINYASFETGTPQPIEVTSVLVEEIGRLSCVRHVQRFCDKQGILKTDTDFKGIALRGVGSDFDPSFLAAHIVEGEMPAFTDSASSNKIVISRRTADELCLTVGSRIYAYFFDKSIRTRRFTVAGIYCTDLAEFDNVLAFTDIYTTQRLNHWAEDQFGGLEIQLNDFGKLDESAAEIVRCAGKSPDAYGQTYATLTIKELYPQIFAWLDLLNINVWVILILMTAVAGFTMISGLLIIILERANFIGIMKAMGATNSTIRRIFLYFSVLIIGRGIVWGNIVGLSLVVLQRYTHLFRLDAATYYVDAVPVLLHPGYLLAVNASTLVICTLALIIPSFLVSHISPVRAIRFD